MGLALLGLISAWRWNVCYSEDTAHETPVVGCVVDENGPVAGATVRFRGHERSTLTDDQGRFALTGRDNGSTRVTASKQGYLIGGVALGDRPLRIQLAPLPPHDVLAYAWVDPTPDPDRDLSCANCHEQIYDEWRASAHAGSVTNRRFLNLYDGTDWHGRQDVGWNLMKDYPDGVSVCSSCHGPSVEFDDPAMFDLRRANGTAALGVHCDFCHKVQDASPEPLGLAHGRDGLNLLLPAKGQVFFGAMDDVDTGEAAYAPVHKQSRVCASCHEGVLFGVHVYSTYSEWLSSSAAKQGQQCQTCHMAPTGQMHNLAPGNGGIDRDPTTLASHRDPGQRADRLRDCVDMAVQVRSDTDDVRVAVTLQLRNVGHRLPTGFIDRHLILVVGGQNVEGKAVASTAGPSLPPIVGSLAGQPGRLFAKQTRDFDGTSPVPFWQARPEVIDTRLEPDRDEQAEFTFPRETTQVHIRLVYRRFWETVTRSKQWPDDQIVIIDQRIDVDHSPRR